MAIHCLVKIIFIFREIHSIIAFQNDGHVQEGTKNSDFFIRIIYVKDKLVKKIPLDINIFKLFMNFITLHLCF